jgi:SAM-dependent methyltransferase
MLFGCSLTRGHFDEISADGEVLRVSGWLFNPHCRVTAVEAILNGELVATQAPQTRDGVARAFPWIPHAAQSAFRFALTHVRSGDRLEILGRRGRRVVARLTSGLRVDLDSAAPTPPAELMRRVAGSASAGSFKANGLKCFTDLVDALRRHPPVTPIRRMLDWGCGCGRLSVHFLLDGTTPEVFGCDIDTEAIAWCQENLRGGTFQSIGPYPPTPYPDHFFDLVIGCSVLTHLQRETQNLWLREMRRVIAPGGLFLASIHGRLAAYFAFPPGNSLIQRLRHRIGGPAALASGFSDSVEGCVLNGIAPDGYYREAFQTRAYTLREWSRYFEVLDFAEGGLAYQDLVVMRRPGASEEGP